MKQKIKQIIKKIPVVAGLSKSVYDMYRAKNQQKLIRNFLKSKKLLFVDTPPPVYFIGHEPTIRCNLSCKMCYQGQNRGLRQKDLDTAQILSIYEKLEDKMNEIKLIGGEPFMRSDIFDLIDFWDKRGKRIIIQTNCTLLTEENIKKLSKFKNISDIGTSLDGPREIHDSIRGVLGTFDRLKNAIILLKKYMPQTPVSVFSVLLLDDNLDCFYETIDTVKELGVSSLNILFEQVSTPIEMEASRAIFEKDFGWEKDSYQLNTQIRSSLFPPDINGEVLRKKLEKIKRYGLKKGVFVNIPPAHLNNLDSYLGKKRKKVLCMKLLSPELRINQKGDVIWCDLIEKSFGNLLEKNPNEIWLSEDFQNFRKYLSQNAFPVCFRCCKATYRE